jgi:hypothetical protein
LKTALIDTVFDPSEHAAIMYLRLKDFTPLAKATFPKTYDLLRQEKAEEVAYYLSGGCTYFILEKHEGVFSDRVECLKNGISDCDITKIWCGGVDSEVALERNWKYQEITQFICE